MHIKIGRDVLFNFLRAEHLLIKTKRSNVKITNSKHWVKKYPNLTKIIEITNVINESVKIYNDERPHFNCEMLTPNQTHLQQEIQIKKWKKKTSKIFTSEV